jgi:AraC family transcriptional activator of tynA and feaB
VTGYGDAECGMPVWDVSRLPERDQFDYWREVICQAFVPLMPGRKDPGPGFASTVETRPLAEVNRARIASRAQTTRHGPREVAHTDGAFYFVNLQVAGRCRTRVGTTDTVVSPGQFVLVDTTQPYYFDFEDDWRMMSYRVPHQLLRSERPGPGLRIGVPVDGAGVGGVVTSLMRALWDVDDAAEPAAMRELERSFAAAVTAATMPAGLRAEPTPRATLRAAVLRHVQDHLTDSSLSVTSVCRWFAISPRTLHNLFADVDETFAATVRGLRLDRTARVLADPSTTATVAEIAAAHGFEDPTTFTRAFRRRFGRRPSDVRGSSLATVPAH